MTQNQITRLGAAPIGPLLLSFSLPAITSTTIVSLYNIISGIAIGQGEGHLAITGLAVTFPFMNLVLAVTMMVAIGGATVCSIELGAGHYRRAAMVLGNNVVLSVCFAMVFAGISLLFLDDILRLFGASEDSLPYAREYMEVILLGAPIGNLMLALNHFMRASGYPTKAMIINLFSVGLNLVLTPAFIFGLQWGMCGAGLATVISQTAALAAMLGHYRRESSAVHFQRGAFRLRKEIVKTVLSVGMSPFLINACACLVIVVINLSLGHYGGDLSIGAYGVVNRLLMLFAMVVFGLTQGMQPLVGYNYGARQMDRVKQTLRYGFLTATAVTSTGFLAFQLFPRLLARLFTDNEEMIDLAARGIRMCSSVFFLVGGQIVLTSFFQSMGRAKVSIFLSLTRQLIFLIPGLILLPRWLGLDGVWLSLPLADVLAFVVAVLTYRHAGRVADSGGPIVKGLDPPDPS